MQCGGLQLRQRRPQQRCMQLQYSSRQGAEAGQQSGDMEEPSTSGKDDDLTSSDGAIALTGSPVTQACVEDMHRFLFIHVLYAVHV